MDIKRVIKRLFGRILAPSYVSAVIWLLTDAIEVVILGVALSVALVVAAPFLETLAEAMQELRAKFEVRRKAQLLHTFVPFINAYKDVLAKYPPELLPDSLAYGVADQLEIVAQHLRTLKGQRTRYYTIPYDRVQAFDVTEQDFQHWELDQCTAFVKQVTDELSSVQMALLKRVVTRFASQRPQADWTQHLQAAERELDRVVRDEIARWRLVQLASQESEIRERVTTLLQLEAVQRQAGLQTYLASPRLQCAPHEVREAMAYLRHDPVVDHVLALIHAGDDVGHG